DSLWAAVEWSLSLAQSQPKAPHLLPMAGKHGYLPVKRFAKATAELRAADRASAIRKACDLAMKAALVAPGICVSGAMQSGGVDVARTGCDASTNPRRVLHHDATRWSGKLGERKCGGCPQAGHRSACSEGEWQGERGEKSRGTGARKIHGNFGASRRFGSGGVSFLRFCSDGC